VSQLRFNLAAPLAQTRESFVVSAINALAVERLEGDWRALVLVGPEGAGKSHLLAAWARDNAAAIVQPGEDISATSAPAIVIDNADAWPDAEGLFHLLNRIDGRLLLAARTPPSVWATSLPDLRSRLNALEVVQIGEPDDAVLAGVLERFFHEKLIAPAADVIPYLLSRMERSVPAARALAERLTQEAFTKRREVNRTLASEVLAIDNDTIDLFDRESS